MKAHLVLGALVLAGVNLSACGQEPVHEEPQTSRVPVRVDTVRKQPFYDVYQASGTVRGQNTTVVTSKTTGYVRSVLVRAGDRVISGQPLVLLESNDTRATVHRVRATIERAGAAKSEAESAYEAARAEAKLAKVLLERESKLLAQAVISQQQFDEVEARYQATAAREQATLARIRETSSSISEAQAALGEAQVSLDYAKIVAPFAGRILERHVDPGALAAPGAPLLVIAEEERLRVEAAVEATRADQVRIGDAVDVEIDTLSRPVQGKVGEIAPSVDVSSRAFLVKIDLPETVEPVHPGTFARVSFHVGSRPRLVVPSSAVSSLGALDRVFVVDGNRARLRMVTVGERQGNLTEVLSGLESSERVVTEPPLALRDGRTVEVAP